MDWIKTKDHLPNFGEDVWVAMLIGGYWEYTVGWLESEDDGWILPEMCFDTYDVEYWCPIHHVPEDKED